MKTFLIALILSTGLMAELYDGVSIVVKEEAITLTNVKDAMRKYNIGVQEAVDVLIRQTLEAQECTERGIQVTPDEITTEIASMARQNNMTVTQFYDAVQRSQNMTASEIKEKIQERLLAQRLYNAIAFSQMDQPTTQEVEEYYAANKAQFSKAGTFVVVLYRAASEELLQQKVNSPMFYSAQIQSTEQTLKDEAIDPGFAGVLNETKSGAFTPIISDPQGGFVTYYVKSKEDVQYAPFENVQEIIKNRLMEQKRKQVLNDYFSRLRHNADIQIIRLPE